MSWPVTNTTRIHCCGDSITAKSTPGVNQGEWFNVTGGLIDQLLAVSGVSFLPSVGARPPATLSSPVVSYSTPPARGRQQNVSAYGVGGRVTSQLFADLQNAVYVWNPDIIVMELGTNDFGTGVTPAQFQTDYIANVDAIHAQLPNCKILCLTAPIRNEQWTAVGPHLTDGLDTWGGWANLQAICAARPTFCEYVDLLTPALAYEMANNTPPPGFASWNAGANPLALTIEGLHPRPLGKVLMANAVMPHFTFS